MPPSPDYAARRRALIRQYHPDVGGDPDTLHRELARLDREFGRDTDNRIAPTSSTARRAQSASRPHVRPTSRLRRIRRTTAKTVTAFRARLPKSVPGSKRYFEI